MPTLAQIRAQLKAGKPMKPAFPITSKTGPDPLAAVRAKVKSGAAQSQRNVSATSDDVLQPSGDGSTQMARLVKVVNVLAANLTATQRATLKSDLAALKPTQAQ
jgi:hypothetical protein